MDDREKDVRARGEDQAGTFENKCLSRREFLKVAGIAGAAVGMGAGLGGLAAACGGETATTTTTAAALSTTTTAAATTTTAAPTTTSAGPAAGREIKLGFVAPLTGALASFGTADRYSVERWKEFVGDGLVCGDGKKHPIKFTIQDSQSDTNRAAQVAGDLILNEKIDIMMVASTPETVNPVADQCEANAIPCFSNDAPWQAFFFGRGGDPAVGFKWTYHHFWGVEDLINVYTGVWKRLATNKIVGAMWPNDSDGAAFSDPKTGFPSVIPGLGYTIIDPGRYQNGTEDFTAQISQFKKAGCEIVTGVPIPPDFTNFWKQCMQQGFKPKIATIAKAVDLPQGVEALGDAGNNFTIETQWTPRMQFKSSLTGETCQQIADEFEKRNNQQWAQYLLHYAVFEVVADSLKRCANVDDKEAIIGAISTAKLDTLAGPIDFTTEPKMGTPHPVKNVCRSPLVGGQWVAGSKYKYELVVVDNTNNSTIKVEAEPKFIA
jgi:branched-chain amino acid transport system substrate-binding protein